ncbi:unnamed protein product [Schistosoma turkestanicum]|nr:unnamed protein product [Schistosoma turkestanicum]
MLAISRISVSHIPLLQILASVSAHRGRNDFSRCTKRSRKDDEFNAYRDAAEFVETSLFGEDVKESVSALRHAKFIERQKHKFAVLRKKYSNDPLELSVLTWKAKKQIIFLLSGEECMDFEQIANSFPITALGAQKLFGNKPSILQRSEDMGWLLNHDSHVIKRWNDLLLFLNKISRGGSDVSESFFGMIPSGLAWLCTSAKMNLLMYADGNPELHSPKESDQVVNKDHPYGRFEMYAAMFDRSTGDKICNRYAQHALKLRKFVETFQKLKDVLPENSFSDEDCSPQLYAYLLDCAHSVNSKLTNQRSVFLPNNVKLRDYFTGQNIK